MAKVIESQLDDASLTKEHQILGTLAYMSPEQLEGQLDQIDTRTDVHALGILAYELLTGRTPYELENEPSSLSYPKALEYARHHEPQSPSSRMPSGQRSQLKGDLDWIVMKALSKEKGRRYDSSSDFANDLARHLRHEPVDAAAPSFFYRARKGARRHAVILGTLGAVCLSLIVGAFMSLKQSRRAETNLATAQAVSAFLGKDLLAIGTGELDKAHYLLSI